MVDWFKILTRQITPQILEIASSPKFYFPKEMGAGFKNQLYIPIGRKHDFYFSGKEWGAFAGAVLNQLRKSQNFLFEHADSCVKVSDEIKSLTLRMGAMDFRHESNNAMLESYRSYLTMFDRYYLFLWTPHVIEEYLEKQLKDGLRERLGKNKMSDKFGEFLNVILTKTRPNLAEQEERELLEISQDLSRKKGKLVKKVQEAIAKHTKKWAWLPFYSFDLQVWGAKYFEERVKKFEDASTELRKRRADTEEKLDRLSKVRAALRGDARLIKLIDATQEYLFLRTDRTDTLRIILYNIKPFLEECGRRMGLAYEDVIFTTPDEIVSFLHGNSAPSIKDISPRKKHFLIVTTGDDPISLVSNEAQIAEIIEKEIGKQKLAEARRHVVLRGVGVYPAIVTGKARIIQSIGEKNKMRKGDVLVTAMTTPEMVEIYSKASAIVTDEGGITCHAAIISRELKIPAVIGTGEATLLLSDRMILKVDSKQGIVEGEM